MTPSPKSGQPSGQPTEPNAFKIKFSFDLTQQNDLHGQFSVKKEDDTPLPDINFSGLFKVPTVRQSLFAIASEIQKTPGSKSFTIRHSLAYVMFADERELVAYDVAELKTQKNGAPSSTADIWTPYLPARYASRNLKRETGTKSNAEYAREIAVAFGQNIPKGEAWWDKAGWMDQEWTLRPATAPGNVKFKVECTLTVKRHLLGEFAGVAPIPPFGSPGTLPVHAIVSGGTDSEGQRYLSGRVEETVEQLTHALRGRDQQIFWIMGEPGSGKEVFAQALHYGSLSGRTKSRLPSEIIAQEPQNLADLLAKDPAFRVVSVAGIGIEEFNERVFSERREQAASKATSRAKTRKGGAKPKVAVAAPTTLIEDVDGGGTIFLDEFDKPNNATEIYNSLLRVLEAKRYIKRHLEGATTPQRYSKVNWIFAGAFTQKDLKLAVPPDLWSRLTGYLKTYNFVAEENYAVSLFLYFYLRSVVEIYSSKKDVYGILRILEQDNDEIAAVVKVLLGMRRENTMRAPKPFLPTPPLLKLADKFSMTVKRKPVFESDRADSSRAIRQAAKAIFDRIRDAAIEDHSFWLGSDKENTGMQSKTESKTGCEP